MGNTSFKKKTEKIVSLQVKALIQIIVKIKTEKKLCSFLSCTRHPLWEGHKILPWGTKLWSNSLKRNKLKVYIFLKDNKLAWFTNSLVSFQLHDLIMISEKNIVAYTFLHHGDACMCQKSQQTKHREKIGY